MVAEESGVAVSRASLVLLSRSYRFGGQPHELFEIAEKTNEARVIVEKFMTGLKTVGDMLFRDEPPSAKLVSACRTCAFFDDDCLGAGIKNTVLELPNLHHTKFKRLSTESIVDLSKIPDDLNLNPKQVRAKESALSGKIFTDPGLTPALGTIGWPCFYLDFETVASVLPLYAGHNCHQQVLTQFSVHSRDGIGGELGHKDYLADAGKDCQRELAEFLISTLGNKGSVVVYSAFEKTRLKALQNQFPDLATPLEAILDRLVDLLSIVTNYVYHPKFKGSFSIKRVLPALVPELSYKELAIGDGDTAITKFARMARKEISGKDVDTVRSQLLEYCKLDTLAMVRLHDSLHEMGQA